MQSFSSVLAPPTPSDDLFGISTISIPSGQCQVTLDVRNSFTPTPGQGAGQTQRMDSR